MHFDGINSFYVNILSSCSMNLFPNNNLSKFKIKLPYDLKFSYEDNWHVGITKFACTSIKNIDKREYDDDDEPRIIFKLSEMKKNVSIVQILRTVPKFLESIDYLKFFDKYINTNIPLLEYKFENNKFLEVYVDNLNKTIKIPTDYIFTSRELFDVYFSQLNKKERLIQVEYLKTWFEINQGSFLSILGVIPEIYPSLIKEYEPLNYLCIYTDIIKPRIIGDNLSRALHMQPIQNERNWTNRNVIDVNNIEYYPLEFEDISEISILFADETGKQINFNNSTFSTMVLLHFKRNI